MLHLLARRRSLIAVLAGLLASYAALVVTAILARPLAFAAALLVASAIDIVVERRFRPVVALLRRAQFGISHRAFVQVFLFLLLVAITDANRAMSRFELLLITLVALTVPVCRIGYLGLLTLVRRRMLPPVEVRNLDLPAEFHTARLPKVLTDDPTPRLMALGLLPVLAGALSVWYGPFWLFGVSVAAYTLIVVGAGVFLLLQLVRLGRRPDRQRWLDGVSAALRAHHPEVVLYFSGSANSVYQAEMWLRTLEKMPHTCVVVVRGRHAIRGLGRTELPIVCIPSAVDLMNFALPDARIALYVANVGNNIHLLREPRVKHVFIGHGDSDKVASFNPFSKVYDQIWVAGPAGRERYSRAQVGVRDEDIVEVGRPQLDMVERRTEPLPTPTPQRPLSVLYLPTWEGWTDDDFQTSLTVMGPALVDRLLRSPIPVRLIYKPHPLTGTRDPRAAAADREIRQMIAAAQEELEPIHPETEGQLDRIARRLARRDLSVAEAERLQAEWHSVYWNAYAGRHVTVRGRLPMIFDCYNVADLMIADVSSVVSDFLASGRPCVVANPKGLDEGEFRTTFPSTRSAYLLNPDTDVDVLLATITGADPLASARLEARAYLLGPDTPPAQERWNAATDALLAAADLEWDGEHGAGPALEMPAVLAEAVDGGQTGAPA
ncbi:hypothetical protein [Actinopolymorpha alba]|uniref:hypothetical protein n=1 Tax=Actinopolymorpha alba TaxID=533267 RepID=UPI00037BAF48|nr:hypothetical protein [Actinopolymorpha alba]